MNLFRYPHNEFRVIEVDGLINEFGRDRLSYYQRALEFRLRRYQQIHGECLFPLYQIDFLSRQYIVLNKEDEILMCVRATPIKRCDKYSISWPLKSSVEKSKNKDCLHAITNFLNLKNNTNPLYLSGLAISNKFSKATRNFAKDLVSAICFKEFRDFNVSSIITGGTVNYNMDRVILEWGFRPLDGQSEGASIFKKTDIDVDVNVMGMSSFHDHGREVFERYFHLFDGGSACRFPIGEFAKEVA
jgi:hypothetical protein